VINTPNVFKRFQSLICVISVTSIIGLTYTQASTRSAVTTGDAVVREWNEIAIKAILPNGPPFTAARFMTIVQLAVFEAVNATTGRYEPYLGTVGAPYGASSEAAAITAAHGVLVTYFPTQAATLNARRDASLAAIPDGQAKTDGIAVGTAAAAAMVADRTGDGSAPPLFHLPANSDPYEWQITLPPTGGCTAAGGVFRHWPNLRPFAIESSSQFRSEAPPTLASGIYARDYNEVKSVGDINSPNRPADRSDVAIAYGRAPGHWTWNYTLLQIASTRNDEITDTARTMALMNMAINDAYISGFESKYVYRTWRPVTAIVRGNEDGNTKTAPGAFTPFIPTPCFPGYPSNHGTGSGAARTVLIRAYGRFDHAITVEHPAATRPDTTPIVLHYTDLKKMTDDVADARVFGGIHFRYDQDAGERQGHAVGQYVYNNLLRKGGDE
jgi:PAP2 superfamily